MYYKKINVIVIYGIGFFFLRCTLLFIGKENGQVYEISHANENVIMFEFKWRDALKSVSVQKYIQRVHLFVCLGSDETRIKDKMCKI